MRRWNFISKWHQFRPPTPQSLEGQAVLQEGWKEKKFTSKFWMQSFNLFFKVNVTIWFCYFRYEAPWTVFSMNWSVRPDKRFRLALGSFVEEYNNKVQIVQLDENASEFAAKSTFDHPYPTTKIMWIPDTKGTYPDLLATSGDYLRVWRAGKIDWHYCK